jgi:hypothetical protein
MHHRQNEKPAERRGAIGRLSSMIVSTILWVDVTKSGARELQICSDEVSDNAVPQKKPKAQPGKLGRRDLRAHPVIVLSTVLAQRTFRAAGNADGRAAVKLGGMPRTKTDGGRFLCGPGP